MNKLLTAQHIYEAAREIRAQEFDPAWEVVSQYDNIRLAHERLAKSLNQDLGLCEKCGDRPIAPNVLLEVAGDNVCSNCCAHPVEGTNE